MRKMSSELAFGATTPAIAPDVTMPDLQRLVGATQRHVLNGPTMGTRYAAVFHARPGLDASAIAADLQAAVDLVDRQMSTWKPDSDLSRLNRAPIGTPVPIPAALAEVLALGLEIGRHSGGAFDIGMGAMVDAWGFGPRGGGIDAAAATARAAEAAVTATECLSLDGGVATRLRPVGIDLSGIAKGYGVDRLAAALEAHGIRDYLVSIDGELRSAGLKPGGIQWAVALEQPQRGRRAAAEVLHLVEQAIATSGDYRHFAEADGRAVSHSIDPRSRRPVDNGIASVTVSARTCAAADAWATALLVLGETEGPALAQRLGIDAIFLVRSADGIRRIEVGSLGHADAVMA